MSAKSTREWMRYGVRRRDAAEAGVLAALRGAGASVLQLTGKDVPDLAVGWAGQTWLVEVKSDAAKLRPGQARLAKEWKGSPIAVARTPAQARALLKRWAARATSLSSLLRAQRAAAEAVDLCTHGAVEGTACEACVAGAIRGGGRDAAWEDHEDRVAERERTEDAA